MSTIAGRKGRRGSCYHTCEALFHLMGKPANVTPHVLKHEGDTHWYLVQKFFVAEDKFVTNIIDPTRKQFKTPPDYTKGRGCGFLTKLPSKRARDLMERMLWQDQ